MATKKVPVTVTYASSGAQPPVYLAGSFSDPAWHPQEMDFTTEENGEHHFHKEVMVEEGGQFQYKFRIGTGDWWALNEKAPIVTDHNGNRNNLLSVPVVEKSTSGSSNSEPVPTPSENRTQIPEVVEKVDDELRRGDGFGANATTAQKDTREMRAQDAEPDYVGIRSESNTQGYADTAAEVADSAAILDREASPSPIPDAEAGRIGERRMSATPIPEVALTAAEVADSAAIIDKDIVMEMPGFNHPHETPWHERAPLFAHECLGPHVGEEEECTHESTEAEPSSSFADPVEDILDINDPLLEDFPQDRSSILAHVRSTESRLSEDETHFDGVPASPITRARSHSPSMESPGSTRLDTQPSPLLDVIAEEHHDDFPQLPSPSKKVEEAEMQERKKATGTKEPQETEVSHEVTGLPHEKVGVSQREAMEEPQLDTVEERRVEVEEPHEETEEPQLETVEEHRVEAEDPHKETEEPQLETVEERRVEAEVPHKKTEMPLEEIEETHEGVTEVPHEEIEEPHEETEEPHDEVTDVHQLESGEKRHEEMEVVHAVAEEHQREADAPQLEMEEEPREDKTQVPQLASSSSNSDGGLIKDLPPGTTIEFRDVEETAESQEIAPEQPPLGLSSQTAEAVLDESTKAVQPISSNGIFSDGEAVISTIGLGDSDSHIRVHAATSDIDAAEETQEALVNGIDTAKSTSLEDLSHGNGDSKLAMRNQPAERPFTPASLHPSLKGKESRNFLKAIWRTVFVEWIGGLFARLWGGGRHP